MSKEKEKKANSSSSPASPHHAQPSTALNPAPPAVRKLPNPPQKARQACGPQQRHRYRLPDDDATRVVELGPPERDGLLSATPVIDATALFLPRAGLRRVLCP
ncbi:hypothetical protein VC83_00138 [Pseudogymnoascus destructans]|uniref:Uncharacterized protein n=1 Tax=Pseudogymnoascus destructans TaxID=655981 RepID=A0A177AQ76_9PEZI|nr:uncharacterized protein VC83_00138 [Pseudogymnoascus destructans]OAF63384.1 hypothetical protein VC83_00138 [Pseudogymnoascus destructans]